MCTYMWIHVCLNVYLCIYLCIHINIHIHAHMYSCIHTYISIYIHINTFYTFIYPSTYIFIHNLTFIGIYVKCTLCVSFCMYFIYKVWLMAMNRFSAHWFWTNSSFSFSIDPVASLTLLIGSGSGYSPGNCSPRCRRTPAVLLLDLSGIRIRCEVLVWISRKQFQTMILWKNFSLRITSLNYIYLDSFISNL